MASAGGICVDLSPRAALAINQAVVLASEQNGGNIGAEELAEHFFPENLLDIRLVVCIL
jgi:hypothetical protein